MCAEARRRGLFLDFDGTLVDSLGLMQEAYFDFLAQFSQVGSLEEFERLNGPTLPEIVSQLKAKYGLGGTPDSLLQQYNRLIDEKYDRAEPMPGAREVIHLAEQAGIIVAIVTSNTRERVAHWLQHRLDVPLPLVITAGEGMRGKPWPDLYQKALALSQCEASLTWAVEDSAHGQQAARAAGINVMAYCPGESVAFSSCPKVIGDLREALNFFQAHV